MGILGAIVRRKVMTTVIVLIAVILGALSYSRIGLRRFPNFEFPMATVVTVFPGGSPEEVETEITKRVEDAISSISGIDTMQSYSQQGISLVIVQFKLEEDIDVRAMDIRDKLGQIQADLPEDAEAPIVGKFNFASMPVLTLALTGPQDVNELYRLADEVLQDRIAQAPGVAQVQITGGQRRQIHLLLDPVKLRKHGVSVNEVAFALQSFNVEVPAGYITEPALEYNLRTTGRFSSVEQVLSVPVRRTAMGVLEVRDLGEVKDAFEDVRSRSRADGGNSVILSVLKQSDANDVEVSDGVQQIMPQLEDLLPQGATIFAVDDTADFVRGALANVRSNMIMGVFLTALALYLFLGSLRGTAIVAVVMPASLIVTFACMLAAGFTMNILTLTALALSMGIVVTNSILVLENTHRFLEQGLMPVDAAVKGTGDIAVPVLASTATNLVVFIPIAFMGEIIGRLFREFGLTIVYVTTVSLFVSFTLTPMMCGAMLKGTSEEERPRGSIRRAGLWVFHLPYRVWTAAFEWVSRRYMELLGWCLRWRWTTLLGMSAVVVACVLVLGVVGAEFFPPSDEGTLRVTVEAPVGSSLEFTDGRVREVEKIIEDGLPKGYLRHCYSRVGQVAGFLGASSQGTNLAEIGVVVIDKAQRKESVDDLLNALRPALAGVRSAKLSAAASGQHGGGSAAISIEVTGNDMEDLKRVTAQIAQLASTVPGATDVDQSYRTGQPEIQFIPDQQKCGRQGLTVRDVALALRTFVEGAKVSQFRDRGEDYDIRLRLAEENRDSAEDVEGMFIVSPRTGQMIRIGELATPRHGAGPNVIMRKNKQRLITVSVGLTGTRSLQEVERDMEQRIAGEVDLPHGVNISFGGQVEMMKKNFGELYKAMGTATLLTFLCTAGLIESFSLAVIILLAVPLCITGVALSLLIGNVTLNLFSLMAMIMVVGMVVNNAIIVLDYAGRPEHAHMPAAARVKDACAVRLRVMTMASLTTVVAMIPLAMGIGFAGEIFRPLAVVQIGGMIAATTICLVVIPVVYAIVEDFRAWWRRRRGHAP